MSGEVQADGEMSSDSHVDGRAVEDAHVDGEKSGASDSSDKLSISINVDGGMRGGSPVDGQFSKSICVDGVTGGNSSVDGEMIETSYMLSGRTMVDGEVSGGKLVIQTCMVNIMLMGSQVEQMMYALCWPAVLVLMRK